MIVVLTTPANMSQVAQQDSYPPCSRAIRVSLFVSLVSLVACVKLVKQQQQLIQRKRRQRRAFGTRQSRRFERSNATVF